MRFFFIIIFKKKIWKKHKFLFNICFYKNLISENNFLLNFYRSFDYFTMLLFYLKFFYNK